MSKQKKYHYIYKTTCKITGKFYVGMHSTDDLEDGYLGSGKILGYSRKKYGDENHVKEVVEYCASRDELKLREKEIVNEDLLKDPLNINLKYGGDGGWEHVNSDKSEKRKTQLTKCGIDLNKSLTFDQRKIMAAKTSETRKQRGTHYTWNYSQGMLGKKHSIDTKQKMSKSGSGINNSQYGTKWVTKNNSPIKIKIEEIEKYLLLGYKLGRKNL